MAHTHLSYDVSLRFLGELTTSETILFSTDGRPLISDKTTGMVVVCRVASYVSGSVSINLQGSSDGSTWVDLGTDLTLSMAREGYGYIPLTGAVFPYLRAVLTPSSLVGDLSLSYRWSGREEDPPNLPISTWISSPSGILGQGTGAVDLSLQALIGTPVWRLSEDPDRHVYAFGQTIKDGVTTYPYLASIITAAGLGWIAGSDIVLPALAGTFIRNIGGSAAALAVSQADATAINGLSAASTAAADGVHTHDFDVQSIAGTDEVPPGSGNGGVTVSGTTDSSGSHTHTITTNLSSTDTETRPANVAFQLCIIAGFGIVGIG